MATGYDTPYRDLNEQISEFSPRSANLLNELQYHCGSQVAYYAAFILICLQAKAEESGYPIMRDLDQRNLEAFTFFEYCKDNPIALTLFNEILDCYRSDLSPQ
jgi:hypothetical protein